MADRIITVTNPSIVTNDTLAGYNNYSDIDGQLGTMMTPAEATNGHTVVLSDDVVHEVTTKPVGTTNGEFSAAVSNAVTVDLASKNWDITAYSASGVTEDITAIFTDVTLSIYSNVMSPDGSKLFIIGRTDQKIYELDITGGDISTAVDNGVSFDLTTAAPSIVTPVCLYISENGLIGYIVDYNVRVNQFNMSSAWDLSTASFPDYKIVVSKIKVASIAVLQSTSKLYYGSQDDWTINRYTADLVNVGNSTIDVGQVLDVSGQISGAIGGIYFSDDLLEIYVMEANQASSFIHQYTMTIAGDLTTATFTTSLDVNVGLFPVSMWFDGNKIIIGERGANTLYEFTA